MATWSWADCGSTAGQPLGKGIALADSPDAVTELPDRGSFDGHLESVLADARSRGEPLALVMVDIDHFKRVNDEHGHQSGDAVLRAAAGCLAAVSRAKGQSFRYGGDELVIVLPNHSLNEAITVAERARCDIETVSAEGIRVSASFGVACFPDHGRDSASLIRCADEALYDAKNRGRNLVRGHGEPEPASSDPREPARKVAEPGRLTEAQKKEMRRRLLGNEIVECPDDGAHLEVKDFTPYGSAIREFFVMCPFCGLSDKLSSSNR